MTESRKSIMVTATCAGLIVLGLLAQWLGQSPWEAWLFIAAFLVGGYCSAKEGVEELIYDKHLNVDILMVLAALGAGIIGYWLEGALLIFIFSLSSTLEILAMAKSTEAISSLMSMTPDEARLLDEDGQVTVVATADLKVGDHVQVLKGQAVPIDGTLLSPRTVLDESMVTGELLPAEKEKGETIIGGTINQSETVEMEVLVENKDTLFAKIVNMVEEAQTRQSKTSTFIERLENTYVKVVLVLVPTFILFTYLVLGWELQTAFYRGMILLTVASPCALLASSTPASLSAISRAAKKGMIIKGGDTADNLASLKAIVFDKTGTLTMGKPTVGATYFSESSHEGLISSVVFAAESKSSHPIAQAILDYYSGWNMAELGAMEDVTGKGFKVSYQGEAWWIGKKDFILGDAEVVLSADSIEFMEKQAAKGDALVYVATKGTLQAIYALSDLVKAESKQVIADLKDLGIKTIMLTGDQEKTAQAIAAELGLDYVLANCLPTDKARHIANLKEQYGYVGMVGDGINDAPALAVADVGFAVGSGTDIAIESADVVIMEDLSRLSFAISLSKKMRLIVTENIVFALTVIVSLIISNLFQNISLPLGVVGHEGSTILVILNSLRLLRYNVRK
ncbi:heavy metal translocating P-type ATPase [Streptococcus sp. X16XC17]|uniref:heavy metal translocating P-type ATPase n=1 Tax=unclassified Streptococcus TaxID=2608887 RepID=UPI00066FF94D|nr:MULTISPECIES: heavy metal translocating P-type ATPase [unclassified Streptococcus]TCD45536.1 heavy metal translocating P-type ATPase [Streptococcus sp. X16XC17]